MKLLFDMHTHILPRVDDGAKSIEESLILINRLRRAGVTDICLTPHYYTHKESLSDFVNRRNKAFAELSSYVNGDVSLHLGAEVFVTKYLFSNDEDLKSVCYSGTKCMLTEFPYSSTFEGESMVLMNKLISNYDITPVLAHVERYPYLLKHPGKIEELIDMGIIIQSNACSFTEFPLKLKLTKLLRNGYIGVIGSDTHSLSRNSPDAFSLLNEHISKKLNQSIISDINTLSGEILNLTQTSL
ncbi:MAG: hypothetical protein IJ451_02060 [Ruminococcus sp.]|nr:hypothetical protein [Ruminococcus sp.]